MILREMLIFLSIMKMNGEKLKEKSMKLMKKMSLDILLLIW